jgi:ABC-type lipoprotein release transport system permease subunit
MIAIGAVIVSIVGSVVAAWRAGRVWPVEALRYE